MINVVEYGVKPNSDCFEALQKLLNTALPTNQVLLYFPSGIYNLSQTLDLSNFRYVRLQGDGANPHGCGTAINGNIQGDLIHCTNLNSSLKCNIADIYFQNGVGNCLHLQGTMDSTINRCRFDASGIGINHLSGFSFSVRDCGFYGAKVVPTSIGIQAWINNATFSNLDIVGWGEGMRLCGMSGIVSGVRAEANAIAFRLGVNPSNIKEMLGRVVLEGLSLEANDVGISSVNMQGCIIQNTHIMGTVNAPSGQSQIAIEDLGSSHACVYQCISNSGNGFSTASFVIADGGLYKQEIPTPTNEWRWCVAANALLNKPTWQIGTLAKLFTVLNYCNN